MAIIYVDGKKYEVKSSDNLLSACLSINLDIPYFCWHPALGSVGVCRQCIVKKYKNIEDTQGQLVISCMTPVTDGTYISIIDNEAKQFRQSIIELLMINHPHDCPVCEEGGNCHLQDMTVMTGQHCRRYRFAKRTHRNQDLGPFILHEMNRCITCYRCVRYYRDYADGTDLGTYGCHDNIYFGRSQSGILENEFSGNLVEICPTGVFTDKTHSERYNRKWDMQFSPSICQQCSVGCNISPGERYGTIRRIENRYNGSVNHYFLCDRGRFGYGYVNLKNRPYQPIKRHDSKWTVLNQEQAVKEVVNVLRQTCKTIGIGSPRASLESNFALRTLVGPDNFYTGMSSSEQNQLELILKILRTSGIHTPSLREIESYDAILILGEDVTQTGARIALAVRQAIKGKAREMATAQKIADWQISAILNVGQNTKYPLFITSIDRTRLDDIASWSYFAPMSEQARLGFAIAHMLDKTAPAVNDIDISLQVKIDVVVQKLANAKKPLIISGSNTGSEEIISAAANIACALNKRGSKVGITFILSEVNSMGLAMMGGGNLNNALMELTQGVVDNVIVLENDLYRRAPATQINSALSGLKNLIVLDHQRTALHDKADLIFSVTNFTECSGTLINQEGRAQRFFQVYSPAYYNNNIMILESWRWLHLLHATYLNSKIYWTQLDHIIDAMAQELPQLSGIRKAAPDATFRVHGKKLAREPHCYSGRTAMLANTSVHEPGVLQDKDTMFTFSMEGHNTLQMPNQQVAFAWSPGWNSPQAWNKFQDEIGGHLRYGDPGIRLLEAGENTLNYFNNIPKSFSSSPGQWCIAPYWHLFGSEETSQLSSVIQKRMPKPYVMLSRVDSLRLGITNNTMLAFTCNGMEFCLPVQCSDNLYIGQIGLPLGFPNIPPILSGLSVHNLEKVVQ
ncbi:NADH-quinone oxidoreductase subunit NuoG [Candidatus Curculioniphilus buchneri]|uniref:NADH-quinone oxidoreductase subunit NuoG n=1 Tax=Candidatus Curculioniphilus buchneri TaxID=690594 RepID=UPI00376F2D3E